MMIMWNSKKYLAMAVVSAGLAVAAASPASAQWFGGGFSPWNSFGMGGVGYGGMGYGGWGGYGGGYGYPTSYYPPYYQQPQIIVLQTGGIGGAYGSAYGCGRPVYGCGRPTFGCGAALGRGVLLSRAFHHPYAVAFHHPARVLVAYRSHHGHLYASYGVKRHYAKHGSLKFA
jgi:hypothetical protein